MCSSFHLYLGRTALIFSSEFPFSYGSNRHLINQQPAGRIAQAPSLPDPSLEGIQTFRDFDQVHCKQRQGGTLAAGVSNIRASPAVEGPQTEIRRYLAPDGCKFRPWEAHVSSGEPRALFEFKFKVDEKRRTLMKFDEI
jgi:hypothetical protein